MKKIFLFILIVTAICCVGKVSAVEKKNIQETNHSIDNYFDQYISADFYTQIKAGNFNRNIFPKFSDRTAWEKARKNKYADMILREADSVLKEEIKPLTFSEFRRYSLDGDRAGYQGLFYDRRKNLGLLTVAMCLTGDKEKYLPKILDYTIAIMGEFTWVLPAHSYWKGDDFKQLGDVMSTDLCASVTGAVMALVHHLIGEELDKIFENLTEKIRKMTLERTVYNVFYNPHPIKKIKLWWFQLGGKKNNWTPWCSYNNMLAAILLEKDTDKLAFYLRRYLQANAHFVAKYGDDGYCNEGPGYYAHAGLNLFEIFNLLHKIRPGSMKKVFAIPKIRAMFEFITRVRIGEKYQVNFGDTHSPLFAPKIDGVAVCAKRIDSAPMRAAVSGRTSDLGGNGQHLNTCLRLLFDVPQESEKEVFPLEKLAFFKDRFAILRSDKFSATMKAGNNLESHNHNDLGHFTLYHKGIPVIVDAGTEKYSKTNFSAKRYTLWYTRGSGHNAPVFGKTEQESSPDYTATLEIADQKKMVCDLGKAYPAAAGVKNFIRTLDFAPEKVVVEDNFELSVPQEVQIKLLSLTKPEAVSASFLKIGSVNLQLEGIEFATVNTRPEMNGSWECEVYEIILKSKNNNYKMIFSENNRK